MSKSRPTSRRENDNDCVNEIRHTTLLLINTSMKPGAGAKGRSAAGALMEYVNQTVRSTYQDLVLLHLRDYPLPLFDGTAPTEHSASSVRSLWRGVNQAGALLISVPAYWCGVSGVFKNFIDVICGAAYDMATPVVTPFTSKPVGFVVVGADSASAQAGAGQAEMILQSTGATVLTPSVVIGNPRNQNDDNTELSHRLMKLVTALIRAQLQR